MSTITNNVNNSQVTFNMILKRNLSNNYHINGNHRLEETNECSFLFVVLLQFFTLTDVSFMPCIAVYMLFAVRADNQGLVILNQAYS